MSNRIIVLKEGHDGEKRVALDPKIAAKFSALGFEVVIETGAGDQAHFPSDSYDNVTVDDPEFKDRDIILCIQHTKLAPINSFNPVILSVDILDSYSILVTIVAIIN